MSTEIVKNQKPEERELEKRLYELNTLEEELAQRELELRTLSAEMLSFESKYLNIVGVRFAKLDEVEARIAKALADLKPTDNEAAKRVTETRNRARDSAKATSDIAETLGKDKLKPSDSLKKLYRNVAKTIHPDLCTDGKERSRREKLMAEANSAFEECDEERLQKILREWESSPESVKGEDVGASLVRVLRKIAQVEERLCRIASEIEVLHKSDLYLMRMKAEEAEGEGRDLLTEMATHLDYEISQAKERLKQVVGKQGHE